jgi:hypothetical protein
MVWVQSSGKPDGAIQYPVRNIMVSPYVEDPALLQPLRLRSFPSPYSAIQNLAVGCGYAAYETESAKVIVVRLADGYSWMLPKASCGTSGGWCFDDAIALTCDELFLQTGLGPVNNIARVRLDALGAPTPPD